MRVVERAALADITPPQKHADVQSLAAQLLRDHDIACGELALWTEPAYSMAAAPYFCPRRKCICPWRLQPMSKEEPHMIKTAASLLLCASGCATRLPILAVRLENDQYRFERHGALAERMIK